MQGETVSVNGTSVDDVLVHVGDASEETDDSRPSGAVIAYTLYFPMTYVGTLSNGDTVTVREHACRVIGFADHERPDHVFGAWSGRHDMVVRVERVAGDMSASITVSSLSVKRDSVGKPTTTTTAVWTGNAQARMTSGSESQGRSALTDASETWVFVAPWQSAFATLAPSSTVITYGSVDYDVTSIENADEKSEFAVFGAVRHGQ